MSRSAAMVGCMALIGMGSLPVFAAPVPEPAPAEAPTAARAAAEPGYDVALDCPERQVWNQMLQARLQEELRAAALQRFSVTIQRERAPGTDSFRYTGQLGLAGEAAGEARSVNGDSCQEVVAALSLIAALTLRQTAAPELPALESPELEPSPPAGFSVQDVPTRANAAREAGRLRGGVAAYVLLQALSAPILAADLGVGVTLSWQSGAWQPWLLLGVAWGGEQAQLQKGAAAVRFDRWSAQLAGCPLRFPRQSALGLRPCLNLDVGKLTGTGVGVSEATQSAALLASTGVGLRLEWFILDQLALGAQLDGMLALTRPRFFFVPEFTALEVPALGLRSGASANLSF